MGVPQTIQSRGQFGFYGAAFMFPIVLLLNVGFIAAQLVIQAQSLQGAGGSLSIPEWVLILAVPAVIIGIFGYRWIQRVMQATTIVVGITLVVLFIQGLTYGSLPAKETSLAHPTPGIFLAGVALLVVVRAAESRALHHRHDRRRRDRRPRLQELRGEPVQPAERAAGGLHPVVGVNLIDFFVIRHGNYNVASFFVPNSRYGNFAWRGLLAYGIGLVAELPFISQTYWIGWFVNSLGGADISWLVGFVVAGGLYLWFAKAWPVRDTAPDLVGGVRHAQAP